MEEREPVERIETLADVTAEKTSLGDFDYKEPQRQTRDFSEMPGGHISIRRHSHSGQGYAGETRRGMQGDTGNEKDYVPKDWNKGSYNRTDPSEYQRLRYLTDQDAINMSAEGGDGDMPIRPKKTAFSEQNRPRVVYSTDDEDNEHHHPKAEHGIRREDYPDSPEPTMSEDRARRLEEETKRVKYFGKDRR